jgi:3-hydroxyacyl-CoA dehydrogenase
MTILMIVKEADWVVEAVVERIDIKHKFTKKFSKIEKKEQSFHPIHHLYQLKFYLKN